MRAISRTLKVGNKEFLRGREYYIVVVVDKSIQSGELHRIRTSDPCSESESVTVNPGSGAYGAISVTLLASATRSLDNGLQAPTVRYCIA
jgi:hypothetical protein